MDIKQFFTDVLPAQGPYIAAVEADHNKTMFSVDEIIQLASMHPNSNMYYCPAAYVATPERTDECVTTRRSLVLDIDIRANTNPGAPNKHYDNADEAIVEVQRLLAEAHLPPYSYMVNSGMGLHVYWICSEDLTVDDFRQVNGGFLQQVRDTADRRVLSDAPTSKRVSGLFRIPNTNNVKHGTPLPCRILDGLGSRLPDDWFVYFKTRPRQGVQTKDASLAPQTPVPASVPAWIAATPSLRKRGPAFGTLHEPTRTDYNKLVSGCAVFAKAIEDPQGLSYHGWIDVARTLVLADDGYARFHEISKLDAVRYDAADVDKKWNDTLAMSKGVRCARLRETLCDSDTTLCQGCPQFKEGGASGSPINLAKVQPEDFQPKFEAKAVEPDSRVSELDSLIDIEEFGPKEIPAYLRSGKEEYHVNQYGELWHRGIRDPDEPSEWITKPGKVADLPFWHNRVWGKPEKDSEQVNKQAEWHFATKDGRILSANVAPSLHYSPIEFCKAVNANGMPITFSSKKSQRDKLYEYCQWSVAMSDPNGSGRGVLQGSFGWPSAVNDPNTDTSTFLVGTMLLKGKRKAERVKLDARAKALYERWDVSPRGSFTEQLNALRMYEHPDVDPVAQLTILFSFASPLIQFLRPGTQCVLLRGASGAGKTSMMKVMHSIWGRPIETILGDNSSKVANQAATAALSNLPAVFDEITEKEANEFRAMVLGVSNAQLNMKLNSDGTVRDLIEEWKLLMVMSSNKPIEHFIPGVGDEDSAARMRVSTVEFPAKGCIPTTDEWTRRADQMFETLESNYGWLGYLFMNHFLDNADRYKARLKELYFQEGGDGRLNAERFRYALNACCRLAGEIIEELGWMKTGSWCDDGLAAAKKHAANNAGSAQVDENHHVREDLEFENYINAMVAAHKDGFLRSVNGAEPIWSDRKRQVHGIVVNDDGRVPTRPAGVWVVVIKHFFDKHCERTGMDPDNLVSKWRGAGHVATLGNFDLGAYDKSMAGTGLNLCYQFKLS